jgi:anti-sigma regulatory factor (Ser/Thr protein kinase)
MPIDPSQPAGARDDKPNTLTVSVDADGVIVLAPHGEWDWRLFLDLYTGINKHLAEHPMALIVDLHDLVDPTTASASLWLTARRSGAAMQPPVEVALCIAPRTPLAARLHRLSAKRLLPLYDTVPEAYTAVTSGSVLTDHMQQRLHPEPKSARLARLMIADACHAWKLSHLRYQAQLVVSELVTNAVMHAGTDMLVTASRRASGLYLAIRDGNPALPRPKQPAVAGAQLGGGGRGLQIVQDTAAAWGALPTHDGEGKVVWATLR